MIDQLEIFFEDNNTMFFGCVTLHFKNPAHTNKKKYPNKGIDTKLNSFYLGKKVMVCNSL